MNHKSLFLSFFKHISPSRKRIRVLIELASFDKGGLEKVVLDSAIAFDRKRFHVTIVTPGKIGQLAFLAKKAGLSVIGLRGANAIEEYDKVLSGLAIDVSISHFSDIGYPLFAKRHIPNITYIHNVYAFFSLAQAKAFTENDNYVQRYISVSRNATRYALYNLGIAKEKITTIPNGLIISEHETRENMPSQLRREDFGLSQSDFVIANVAAYNLHKGHYVMADAMQHLLSIRKDIKILCVGSVVYPPHLDALRRHLSEHGLEQHVLMPGYVANAEDVLRLSDAFVLPSFIEGWSIAMNEAMFYKKPLILTDTGASAEVIEENDIGILIPNEYGDTIDLSSELLNELAYHPRHYKISPLLAEAMNLMASDRAEWQHKAIAGREKIYNNYDFSNIIKRYEAIIEEMVL